MMFANNSYLDIDLLKQLLDIYFEQTGLSIAFHLEQTEDPVYSTKNWPNFCIRANELIGQTTCQIDKNNLSSRGLFQCNTGLWCYSYPLLISEKFLGSFIFGHRVIKGKEQETVNKLNQTLERCRINQEDAVILLKLLDKEIPLERKDFLDDVKLLERLSFIESYIILEHMRFSKEHEKVMALKNEYESLAHEFLLPIQSIVADAENLMELTSETKDKNLMDASENIIQEIIKLSYTAEKIRGSATMDKDDKPHLEFEFINICDIISEMIDLFRKEAINKNSKIEIIVKEYKSLKCQISKYLIQQIFFNLIQNAVQYSFSETEYPHGKIEITFNTNGRMFECEISNIGIGILPEELEKIFEKGYRGKLTRDLRRIGSGNGLFKVKEIVALHNGNILVESRKIGNGKKADVFVNTFKVSIPYKQNGCEIR